MHQSSKDSDPNWSESVPQNIVEEYAVIEPGTYQAEIIGIGQTLTQSKYASHWFIHVGIKILGLERRVFFIGYPPALKMIMKTEPYFTGKKVMVKVTKRRYDDIKVYNDFVLLWDEAFEELNGL